MKQNSCRSIILKRIKYSESDRIVTAITNSKGKISLLAKGVRKAGSKNSAGLELFTVSEINYIDSKSDLKILTTANIIKNFNLVPLGINVTLLGYEFIGLINTFTEVNCEPEYFDLLYVGLEALANKDISIDIVNCWFLSNLLNLSGHALDLANTSETDEAGYLGNYILDFDKMSFTQQADGKFTKNHIKFLRLCQSVSILNLARVLDADRYSLDLKESLVKAVKLAQH